MYARRQDDEFMQKIKQIKKNLEREKNNNNTIC
jgi:hypothetical protein